VAKIFFVDDETEMLEEVKEFLEFEGYEVGVCDEGPRAYESVMAYGPDLVVLDIRIPGVDGLELLHELKQERPELKILMLTGYTDTASESRARELGAMGCLKKPIGLAELQSAVAEALAA